MAIGKMTRIDHAIRLHADDDHKSVTDNRESIRHHLKTVVVK